MGRETSLLKVPEIAADLGVSTGRVYQLISDGVIPAIRVGGAIRIPRSAWEEWLRQIGNEALGSLQSDATKRIIGASRSAREHP